MLRVRSRIALTQPSETRLVLRNNPRRRIMFAVVAALLLLAFFLGVDWQSDFQGPIAVGTVFYFVLTTTCLAVAAWGTSVSFDSRFGSIDFSRRIAGIEITHDRVTVSDVEAVTIQGVRFLNESEQPRPGLLNTRFRTYVERRNNYYKLYLDLSDRRQFLEDSSELGDLDAVAERIAGFLSVPFRREHV